MIVGGLILGCRTGRRRDSRNWAAFAFGRIWVFAEEAREGIVARWVDHWISCVSPPADRLSLVRTILHDAEQCACFAVVLTQGGFRIDVLLIKASSVGIITLRRTNYSFKLEIHSTNNTTPSLPRHYRPCLPPLLDEQLSRPPLAPPSVQPCVAAMPTLMLPAVLRLRRRRSTCRRVPSGILSSMYALKCVRVAPGRLTCKIADSARHHDQRLYPRRLALLPQSNLFLIGEQGPPGPRFRAVEDWQQCRLSVPPTW